MKITSILFSLAIPAAVVATLAGAPALPALAFATAALVIGLAISEYGSPRPGYHVRSSVRPVVRRHAKGRARLPLAA